LERFDEDYEPPDEILADALTGLIRQGIVFTTETMPDGRTEYVVDRVRLKAEEIRLLQEQGALTLQGIRSYLVSRK
jgi:hypothetical protein